ncbi:PQQ-dependent sugar dehydrogenase [Candidatus Nitrosocosmicus hydrocola]|uniref:PQQ-dependent sugar dehydrogenase n=1 Tax=Candidatus Nitrosocosmicus hydrocola TaxID=1826872 RepID=UPI0011E5CAFC|nr:PQQ-dependent sugar dehydrogenase [Candidatus Nitrosocosmicus hydrocola]
MIKLTGQQNSKIKYVTIILIPIVLASFTHLWNPTGFPTIYIDEDHYMRRALQVMEGQGPQESSAIYDHPYDHPYFGQIFLASLLKISDYKFQLEQETETSESIQQLYTTPRILMGILAVIDTILVFKIGEMWLGRKVGFVGAILFAIMPLTWMLKMVLLDTILLPFVLSSILLAIYSGKAYRNKTNNGSLNVMWIILSGITLGLAIFTKIPIITFIPLVGYLIYKNNKSLKKLGIWLIPVLVIPLIWPAYVMYIGELENGINGILYQVERGERNFDETISFIFLADPVLIILGICGGIALVLVKRDFTFLIWTLPYFLFIYFIGGIVKYFHFIELLPIMAIASGFIIVTASSKISLKNKRRDGNRISQTITLVVIVAGIGLFGLISTIMLISANTNEVFFELSAFVSNYVTSNTAFDKSTTLMGQHWIRSFSWIPMYVHDKTNFVKDVFPERYLKEPLKTDDVLMIVDSQLKHDIFDYSVQGEHLDEIRKIYHNSDRTGLFVDSPTRIYDTNQYPFTNMKESRGLGLIEVRSNQANNQMAFALISNESSNNTNSSLTTPKVDLPTVTNPNLRVEMVASGLSYPSTMAFVGKDDLLVLEKNNGTIKRIVNGNLLDEPILDLNVANKIERGLLGIDVARQTLDNATGEKTYVYVYYTQALKDGNDVCPTVLCDENTNPLGNRIYRFEWTGNELVNPNLILDLPVGPGADHNGGVIKVGPDGNIYALVGDGDSCWEAEFCNGVFEDSTVYSESSNVPTGNPPDGRGGILSISPFGEPMLGGENKTTGILARSQPLKQVFCIWSSKWIWTCF